MIFLRPRVDRLYRAAGLELRLRLLLQRQPCPMRVDLARARTLVREIAVVL